jgi:hypothetical protein
MRTLPILAAVLLAMAAPLASAQVMGGNIALRFPPIDHALVPGEQVDLVGTAELTTDASAFTGLQGGVPVHYTSSRAPTWAGAIISSPDDLFANPGFPGPSGAFVSARPLRVTIVASDATLAQGTLVGAIEISAIAVTSWGSVSGRGEIPLLYATPQPPCPAGMSAQDAGVVPLGAAPALGAWELGALAVGLALGLATRRHGRAAIPLAVLALGMVAPVASAQSSGAITFSPLTFVDPIAPGHVADHTSQVTLTTDATGYASSPGIPVEYHVSQAPPWAVVVVSPATDVFTYVSTRPLQVQVLVGDVNFTGDRMEKIEITAVAVGKFGSLMGKTAFPVAIHAEPRCVPAPAPAAALRHAAVAAKEVAHPAPSPSGTLTVQTHAATPATTGLAIVGGFGLAGAGAGLVLARRRGK